MCTRIRYPLQEDVRVVHNKPVFVLITSTGLLHAVLNQAHMIMETADYFVGLTR